MVYIKVKKLVEAAQMPRYAHMGEFGDLAADLYASADARLAAAGEAGSTTAVPTGIAMEFPPTHGALVEDRSGLAVRGVTTLAGVIDPGYRGEIRVVMTNLGARRWRSRRETGLRSCGLSSGSRRASRRLRSWARQRAARGDLEVRGSDEPTSQNRDVGHPATRPGVWDTKGTSRKERNCKLWLIRSR